MDEKVVFEGKTTYNKPYIIRYPRENDAQAMCNYINTISKEQTFIRFQGEQITLEEEARYLQSQLEKISNKKSVQLMIFCGDDIMGISAVDLKDKTESHEGVFGISIAKDIRGEGIGRTLMRLTLEEAEKNLKGLRVITLGVFGNNALAQEMYKKFGFQEYGRLPGGILHRGQYVDHIYLYKHVTRI